MAADELGNLECGHQAIWQAAVDQRSIDRDVLGVRSMRRFRIQVSLHVVPPHSCGAGMTHDADVLG
jgi:hypothetical protein